MPTQDRKGGHGIEFYGGYPVYDENGIDLTTLRRNLTLPLEMRVETNRRGAATFHAVRHRGKKPQQTTPPDPRPFVLDIPSLLERLNQHHVRYVVVGGLARIAHGSNHATLDLDVCYDRSPNNLKALAAALVSLQAYLRGAPKGLPFKFDVPTLQAGLNFTTETASGDLALLGEVSGVGHYADALARSSEETMFGKSVRILSLDALIDAKKAAGRNKDRSHLLELEALRNFRDDPPPPDSLPKQPRTRTPAQRRWPAPGSVF